MKTKHLPKRAVQVISDYAWGKWKGCSHVLRGLYQCQRVLEELVRKQASQAK